VRSPRALRSFALASVIANVVIVVTGGAVRLTNSGLGCPTWPSCTDASLTPTKAYSFHGIIEFTNRQLTFVLVVIAIATFVVAWCQHTQVRLALLGALSIPAQALLGGLVVLTDLNPWLVGAHFLLSMAIIAVAMVLWWRLARPAPLVAVAPAGHAVRSYGQVLLAATAVVLALGTMVTGAGPHAGDLKHGKVHRNGLTPSSISQLHADSVMLLIGLTVGLLILARVQHLPLRIQRAARDLLIIELAQGLIGFVQYFTHLPALLVAVHMLGACTVWIAALRLLLLLAPATNPPAPPTSAGGPARGLQQLADGVDEQTHQRADHGAIHADELKVTTDL
jgi:cytochrome c oxidase assembly protein subunit 15